jgi:hypothetical protein
MENVGILNDNLEYFTVIWYISRPFGIFFPIWNVWTKKYLATLLENQLSDSKRESQKFKFLVLQKGVRGLGSMLKTQFSASFANFSQNQCYVQMIKKFQKRAVV